MLDYVVDLDTDVRKWLKGDLTLAMHRGLVRAAKETRKSVATHLARKIRDGKYYPGSKIKDLKQHILFHPKNITPSLAVGGTFSFVISPSSKRLNLYKLPFRMKRVSFKRNLPSGKKKTIRINQILTSVYGRPFQVDALKPFFVMFQGGDKGKYFYKGKPKRSEKPIAMHRKEKGRYPLKQALAPSLRKTLQNTPGLFPKIASFAEDKWQDRVQRNVGFFIDQISDR